MKNIGTAVLEMKNKTNEACPDNDGKKVLKIALFVWLTITIKQAKIRKISNTYVLFFFLIIPSFPRPAACTEFLALIFTAFVIFDFYTPQYDVANHYNKYIMILQFLFL